MMRLCFMRKMCLGDAWLFNTSERKDGEVLFRIVNILIYIALLTLALFLCLLVKSG